MHHRRGIHNSSQNLKEAHTRCTTHKLHASHIYNTRTASPRLHSHHLQQPGLHTFSDAGAGAGAGAAAGATDGASGTWDATKE